MEDRDNETWSFADARVCRPRGRHAVVACSGRQGAGNCHRRHGKGATIKTKTPVADLGGGRKAGLDATFDIAVTAR